MTDARAPNPDAQALATLLDLSRRARAAGSPQELSFLLVNETHRLCPYRQAALWLDGAGVTTLSGIVAIEANAPYVHWLGELFAVLTRTPLVTPVPLDEHSFDDEIGRAWPEWLPPHALVVPVPAAGTLFGGGALLLAREASWTEGEAALLTEWVAAWAFARAARHVEPLWTRLRRTLRPTRTSRAAPPASPLHRRRTTWIVIGAIALLIAPVHLSVLAPADLVPVDPALIRAPLDGVIERVLVTPNQPVAAGDPLVEFDRASLDNRLAVAREALATVEAEYRQKAQQALFDPAVKAQLAVLYGQVTEKSVEADYLAALARRGRVVAPRAGVALLGDPAEWSGRPVVTGERIMVIADEHAVEVEAWLAPADAIDLADGAPVTLYLNAQPLAPVSARLRSVSHEAAERPDGKYAYRVRAALVSGAGHARVGLKGTARIEGPRVPLVYWMLRRPLAAARAWLGV